MQANVRKAPGRPRGRRLGPKKIIFIVSFTIIPVAHFCLFYIYVNFNSLLMAFQKPFQGKIIFTFDNFVQIWQDLRSDDGEFLIAIFNTLKTFALQMVLFPIGMLVSYFIYKKIWGYKTFRVMLYLPAILSSIVVSYVFMIFVSQRGPVPGLVQKLFGLDYAPDLFLDSRFANKTILFHVFWFGFPGNMILWGGAFSRIPQSIIDSGRIDGVGWVREMFSLILPCVWPTFTMLVVMSIAGFFGASGPVFLLTKGAYKTQTVSSWMYIQVQRVNGNANAHSLYYMSTFGFCISVISCTLAFVVRKFLLKHVGEVEY